MQRTSFGNGDDGAAWQDEGTPPTSSGKVSEGQGYPVRGAEAEGAPMVADGTEGRAANKQDEAGAADLWGRRGGPSRLPPWRRAPPRRYGSPFVGTHGPGAAVTPIRQPSQNSCWATAYAMMYGWKNSTSVSPRDAVAALGGQWLGLFDADRALDRSLLPAFAADAGLQLAAAVNYTLDQWVELLDAHGPLQVSHVVGGGESGPGHYKILVGVEYTGSEASSTMYFVDPGSGTVTQLPYLSWAREYEERVRRGPSAGHQILHW